MGKLEVGKDIRGKGPSGGFDFGHSVDKPVGSPVTERDRGTIGFEQQGGRCFGSVGGHPHNHVGKGRWNHIGFDKREKFIPQPGMFGMVGRKV